MSDSYRITASDSSHDVRMKRKVHSRTRKNRRVMRPREIMDQEGLSILIPAYPENSSSTRLDRRRGV